MDDFDHLSGLFWFAISIFVCIESMKAGIGTFHFPGSGFLPFWAAVFLGTLSIASVVSKVLLKKKTGGEIKSLWKGTGWRKVVWVLTSLILYAILLGKLGYLITTFGLMVFLFTIVGKRRIWIQVISALMTALLTYVIFYTWLEVLLPKGIWGF